MRKAQMNEFVASLVTRTWTGVNADVAESVLADEDAFGALVFRLQHAGGNESDGLTAAWNELVDQLDDSALDFLAERADNPAGFLASRVG
ncbi:hypothetical protein [Amycolatopsis sacchari]|uniref:hypothetical protein n=1 Tax=Amycolatopsis sacchari TaxID=115433 RepID=UPI003D72080F